MAWDPLYRIEGIPSVQGPTSINAQLLDGVNTANFEGLWVPWLYVKQGSLEISGTFATLSCQLYGTNAISPLNSFTATIGGTITNGDTVSLNFSFPASNLVTITVPVVTAETTAQIAAALVAGINANPTLASYGVQASAPASVITITWPSPSPFPGQGTYTTSNPDVAPVLTLTSAVTGGATETVAIAPGVGGSTLGSAITAAGMTQFTFSARWLKIRVTTLTGGNVNAIAQGTA